MASIVGMSLKKYQGSLPGCQRSQSSAALPFRFFLRPERQKKNLLMKNQMQPITGLERLSGLPVTHLMRTVRLGSQRFKKG